jgi:S1-C subfamily serine protease
MKCALVVKLTIISFIFVTILSLSFLPFYNHRLSCCENSVKSAINSSVTIVSVTNHGSGVVFINSGHTFVWTNAHVVSDALKLGYNIDFQKDEIQKSFKFLEVVVQKEIISNNKKTGYHSYYAEVIRFNMDEDLALLKLHCDCPCHNLRTTTFLESEYVLAPGVPVFHIGSPGGPCGEGFLSKGNMSAAGRNFDNSRNDLSNDSKLFDLVSIPFFNGSSGGGVFQENGCCIGLISQKLIPGNTNAALIIPARRIRAFAIEQECEWAVDHRIKLINEQLKQRVTGFMSLTPKSFKKALEE